MKERSHCWGPDLPTCMMISILARNHTWTIDVREKVQVNVCYVLCSTMLHKPLGVYWQTSCRLRHRTDSITIVGGTHICNMVTFSLHNWAILLKLSRKLVNNILRMSPLHQKMNAKTFVSFQQLSVSAKNETVFILCLLINLPLSANSISVARHPLGHG